MTRRLSAHGKMVKKTKKYPVYNGVCPSCKGQIRLEKGSIEEYGYVDCPNCWELLEIISINPLKLAVSYIDNDG